MSKCLDFLAFCFLLTAWAVAYCLLCPPTYAVSNDTLVAYSMVYFLATLAIGTGIYLAVLGIGRLVDRLMSRGEDHV